MYLEQRLQMQEDEVQLLKIALADVLKRLNISEAQTAAHTKRGPVKGTTLPHIHTASAYHYILRGPDYSLKH